MHNACNFKFITEHLFICIQGLYLFSTGYYKYVLKNTVIADSIKKGSYSWDLIAG